MAEDGRIERETLWRIRPDIALELPNPWRPAPIPVGRDIQCRIFIPESSHSSEINRLAGELEARAGEIEKWIAEKEENASLAGEVPQHLGRHRGEAKGLRRSAELLRGSLTRGERE